MLGVSLGELLPSFEQEEETIRVDNAEIKLNDMETINEYKNFIDKINSLT